MDLSRASRTKPKQPLHRDEKSLFLPLRFTCTESSAPPKRGLRRRRGCRLSRGRGRSPYRCNILYGVRSAVSISIFLLTSVL